MRPGLQTVDSRPWLLVSGGFHRDGGMDKANAALATYLCAQGCRVHLVSHRVDPELAEHPAVTLHLVKKPLGSFFLGEMWLDRVGRAIARELTARADGTRVIVNGSSCDWSDVNWVHCVHSSWAPSDRGAPAWFRIKNNIDKSLARRAEAIAFKRARVLLTNSDRTRRDLINHLGVPPDRVHTVYLGADSDWNTITQERRAFARAWLDIAPHRPLVAFVGALGYDSNKGFDTLWKAWQKVCEQSSWDADLVVAGGGRALEGWRTAVGHAGLGNRVRMLGFTDRVPDVLAASDLLVSPVRYESYGLNVQEAICCGVPAIVSAAAGVAERYPADLNDLLLSDPEDSDELASRILRWRSDIDGHRRRVEPMAQMLRAHTWEGMAKQIVTLIERGEVSANALQGGA